MYAFLELFKLNHPNVVFISLTNVVFISQTIIVFICLANVVFIYMTDVVFSCHPKVTSPSSFPQP